MRHLILQEIEQEDKDAFELRKATMYTLHVLDQALSFMAQGKVIELPKGKTLIDMFEKPQRSNQVDEDFLRILSGG